MNKTAFHSKHQHTLKQTLCFEGIGLHSGAPVALRLEPAAAHQGIRFIRTDLAEPLVFPANAQRVGDTKLGTSLTHPSGATLSTVEHLMAALWGAGVDNLTVYVNGPEIPIMDGSSLPFLAPIEKAGMRKQSALRHFYTVHSPLELTLDDTRIEILPYDGFAVDVSIDFTHAAIGRQHLIADFSDASFHETLANARTFGFLHEVEYLKTIGLARGGSLENAIVLDKERVLNPEGLRDEDEFVQHKALDLVGDLFLSMGRIRGYVRAIRPGHTINTAMARLVIENVAASSKPAKAAKSKTYTAPTLPALGGKTLPAFA